MFSLEDGSEIETVPDASEFLTYLGVSGISHEFFPVYTFF
jgi:hypothetical protein